MNDQILLNLWHRAQASEIGVGIKIEPKHRRAILNLLYKTRQESGDPELENLIIMLPNDLGEIYICHKHQEGLNAE